MIAVSGRRAPPCFPCDRHFGKLGPDPQYLRLPSSTVSRSLSDSLYLDEAPLFCAFCATPTPTHGSSHRSSKHNLAPEVGAFCAALPPSSPGVHCAVHGNGEGGGGAELELEYSCAFPYPRQQQSQPCAYIHATPLFRICARCYRSWLLLASGAALVA